MDTEMRKTKFKAFVIAMCAMSSMWSLCSLGDTYRRLCPQCGKTWWTDSPLDNFCGQCRRSAKEIDHKFDTGTSATSTSDIYWQGLRNMQKNRLDRNRKFNQAMGDRLDQHTTQKFRMLQQQAEEIARTQGGDRAREFLLQKFEEDRRQKEALLRIPKWNLGTYQLQEQMKQGMFNQWFRSGRPDELQKLQVELSPPMGNYHAQYNPQKYQMLCQRYQELTGQQPTRYGEGQVAMSQSPAMSSMGMVTPQNAQQMVGGQMQSIDPLQMEKLQQLFCTFMQQYGRTEVPVQERVANQQGTRSIEWYEQSMAKFRDVLAQNDNYRMETRARFNRLARRLGGSRCQELWVNDDDLMYLVLSQVLVFRAGFEFVFYAYSNGTVKRCRNEGIDVVEGFADAIDLDGNGIIFENEFVAASLAFNHYARDAGYDYNNPLNVLQWPIMMKEKQNAKDEYQIMIQLHKGRSKTITKRYLAEYIRVLLTVIEMFT